MKARGTKYTTALAQMRLDSGLKMAHIEEKTGITQSSLSRWEGGYVSTIPDRSWDKAVRLADLYGVSVSYLQHLVEDAWRQKNQLNAKGVTGEFKHVEQKKEEPKVDIPTKPEFRLNPQLVTFDEFCKQMDLAEPVKVEEPEEVNKEKAVWSHSADDTSTPISVESDGLLERIYGKVDYSDFVLIQRMMEVLV